jgi:hypothetical protein
LEIEIRPGQPEDHDEIIAGMRRIEHCSNPIYVRLLLENAWHFEVALADGKIAAAWGVIGDFTGPTIPWLLTTPIVEQYYIRFLRESRRQFRKLAEKYGKLDGFVEVDYARSIRWLEWVGAKFTGEATVDSGARARTFTWQ